MRFALPSIFLASDPDTRTATTGGRLTVSARDLTDKSCYLKEGELASVESMLFSPHILGAPSILIPNPGNFPLILHRRNLSIPLLLILIGCMWSHATEGKVLHVCQKITLMYQMPLSLAPYSNSNSCFIKKNYTNIFQSKFWKCIFAFVILWDCSHLIGSTLLDNQQRHK